MILQCFQVALAVAASGSLERGIVALFGSILWALSVIAYVPMGVMLGAVAAASFAYRAVPRWLAWFSFATALAHFVMTLGLVVESGPLVPGQATTYALYAIASLWLIATTTVMVFGLTEGHTRIQQVEHDDTRCRSRVVAQAVFFRSP